ncbi:MAG: AAA family ATPase, partial [Acidobacteria bacterium]
MSNGADRPSPSRAFRVTEARSRDVGRNIARLDPQDLEALGLSPGQAIEIVGRRRTVAMVMPSLGADRRPQTIQIDGLTRGNADVDLDEQVTIRPVHCAVAERVTLAPASRWDEEHLRGIEKYLGKLLNDLVVVEGDLVRLSPFGISAHDFKVLECRPAGPVRMDRSTIFEVVEPPPSQVPQQLLVYEDIGGLKQEVQRLREMVEVPLKHPEIFERLGVSAPRAILLSGPAGVGKSLMARVVAEAAQARFLATSGPEILNKYYHQEESHLRDLFEQAVTQPPAVIFIDELERIASKQCLAATEAEKHIATELLTLLDQLERNGRVVVIGSTTSPDEIDPTFRRHGRFEREISVQPPRHKDRREILEIHSRGIPLAEDVDLDQLAALTQGFVGADLSILCQEAAFIALRQKMIEAGCWGQPSFEMLADIRVTMAHFLEALRTITPSLTDSAAGEFAEASWDDIGGLHEVREQLMEAVIRPLQSPELFTRVRARPVRGVLLHGPPGTGKTLLAGALAKETGITFIPVKAGDLIMGDPRLCE